MPIDVQQMIYDKLSKIEEKQDELSERISKIEEKNNKRSIIFGCADCEARAG